MEIERTGKAAEHYREAMIHSGCNELREAIAEYTKVIELLPNDAESYDSRGTCYLRLEQLEEAVEDYEKAISLDPKNGEYYSGLFPAYIRLGEDEKAAEALEKAVKLNPKEAGTYYFSFGNNLLNSTGNKREAAVYFKKSVEHGDYDGYAKKKLAELGM